MDPHCPLHLGLDGGGFAVGRVAEAAVKSCTALPRSYGRRLPAAYNVTRAPPHNAASTPGDLIRHAKARRDFSIYPRVLYFFYPLAETTTVSSHPATDITLCLRECTLFAPP